MSGGRRRNETNRQWMDRLRAARGLPAMSDFDANPDNLMIRTRAAVCFENSRGGSEASKLNAFLALFHPEIVPHSPEWFSLMQDARERDRTR
jgi:hypothetical protein